MQQEELSDIVAKINAIKEIEKAEAQEERIIENRSRAYNKLLDVLGYEFADEQLLTNALTLASGSRRAKYERLEFLGDRVLGLVIAEMLYKTFPDENEGQLARRHAAMVKGKTCARMAKEIYIDKCVEVPKSEEANMEKHPDKFLADLFEAVLGALYLDGGYNTAKAFIERQFMTVMLDMKAPPVDSKTKLQEWLQAQGMPAPVYTVVRTEGPSHAPIFTIEINIDGYEKAQGTGPSKKFAEAEAALNFLMAVGVVKFGD